MDTSARLSTAGYDLTTLSRERTGELCRSLTKEQLRITQRAGTEAAFCGGLVKQKRAGVYACLVCGLPLFDDSSKFESGTGWPSFHSAFDPEHVRSIDDSTHGMVRTEIRCARCDAHLGHVFPDGPPPTGQRHCLNSDALRFVPASANGLPAAAPTGFARGYFAGGCFWGVEHGFAALDGVVDVVSGYQGGQADSPNYQAVCTGTTGHTETVEVLYDPARISFRSLLEHFFRSHDPTTRNRQGPDVGSQYRSAIFVLDDAQRAEAEGIIDALTSKEAFPRPIITEVTEATTFWPAEEYHQDYHEKHGGSCGVG